jgi:hypothetical protein
MERSRGGVAGLDPPRAAGGVDVLLLVGAEVLGQRLVLALQAELGRLAVEVGLEVPEGQGELRISTLAAGVATAAGLAARLGGSSFGVG